MPFCGDPGRLGARGGIAVIVRGHGKHDDPSGRTGLGAIIG